MSSPSPATPAPHRTNRPDAGKYHVPASESDWDACALLAERHVRDQNLIAPLALDELRAHAATLATANALPEHHREFLMIQLNNAVWRDVLAAIPFRRRTLLLPPCLRASHECPAQFDEFGLLCEQCGRCDIGALSAEADALGYAVLVAEGTTLVADLIRKGLIDAVIGVSCMPTLERTFPHLFTHAVPGIAIPLIKEGCADTTACTRWVRDTLKLHNPSAQGLYPDLKQLHNEAQSWFQEAPLRTLLRAGHTETETISLAWLAKSGKRWRPFLAVAVYRAFKPGPDPIPDSVRTVAIALECIHKASLVYDDIQDNDDRRYGDDTVHHAHGVPVALTAALYLLGQGYRLIAESGASMEDRLEMVKLMTEGHCELCLGQGGELCWMQTPAPLSMAQVVEIFRLKTAPSFDVVFRLGAICGGATAGEQAILKLFSEALGIAYQILDDLQDFKSGGDVDDIKSGRPSIVIAAACEAATGTDRQTLIETWCRRPSARAGSTEAVRALILHYGGEDKARAILEEYKDRALRALRPLTNRTLKLLLHRIVGMLFDKA